MRKPDEGGRDSGARVLVQQRQTTLQPGAFIAAWPSGRMFAALRGHEQGERSECRRGTRAASGASSRQRQRFREYSFAEVGRQAVLGDDIDLATEQVFEVLLNGDQVEQASFGIQPNEEVEIAIRCGVTAGSGSEYSHRGRAVFMRNAQDFGDG